MKAFIGLLLFTLLVGCENKQTFGLVDQSQKFGQQYSYNNKVDVLMVIDNSSSMLKHQENLSLQVPVLINSLNRTKLDYNIAVITTDMSNGGDGGQFVGSPKVLNYKTQGLVDKLKANILRGQEGSTVEQGIESIMKAMDPTYLANTGAGFLRADALLAILVLSDENDQGSETAEQLRVQLDQLKTPFSTGVRSWVLNYLGVTELDGPCRTFGSFASVGLKYMELAQLTGGAIETLCTNDFSTAVSNLRVRIENILTDYHLNKVPNLSTIRVSINGQLVQQSETNGWSYIESLNAIRFHGAAVPPADAAIQIDFTPAGAG